MLKTEQIIRIRELYLSRIKLDQIAEMTGETPWRVRKVIYDPNNRVQRPENPNARPRKKKIKPTPVAKPNQDPNPVQLSSTQIRILVLTNFGYSAREIAEDLQIKPNKVREQVRLLYRANKIQKRV